MFRSIGVAVLVLGVVAGLLVQHDVANLLETGAAYRAKTLCSGVHVSGRALASVDELEFRRVGDALSSLMLYVLSADEATATTADGQSAPVVIVHGVFGLVYRAAVYRGPSLGCSLLPRRWRLGAEALSGPVQADYRTPLRESWSEEHSTCRANASLWRWPQRRSWPLMKLLAEEARDNQTVPTKNVRGLVVVHRGAVLAELYDEAHGFAADTPQHGWSMTKSVLALLVGIRLHEAPERLPALDQPVNDLVPEWRRRADVPPVTLAQLLRMESALDFADEYSPQGRVVEMLFRSDGAADYAARQPFVDGARPGQLFAYSSGVTNIVSRLLRDSFDRVDDYYRYPSTALFNPLQMSSAVMELDAAGVFVGSSFSYATPRDYAKFGLLLLQRGRWITPAALTDADAAADSVQQVVPEAFIDWLLTPSNASGAVYAGHLWTGVDPQLVPTPPSLGRVVAALGHDCQVVAVLPDHDLVVVRMGLTKKAHDQCHTTPFLQRVVDAVAGAPRSTTARAPIATQ